jgi:quercetin dioxygenase-like cupin family protein
MAQTVLTHPASGDRVVVLVSARESAGARFRFEHLAGRPTPPPVDHVHPDQEESVEVLAGMLHCRVAGREHRLGPGDSLVIPAGVPHAVWNQDPAGCRSVGEFRPALDTQALFEAAFVPVTVE